MRCRTIRISQHPFLAALRKGKSHYVCDERLRQHLQQRPNGKNVMQKKELYSLRDVLDLDETQKLSSFDREAVSASRRFVTANTRTAAIAGT